MNIIRENQARRAAHVQAIANSIEQALLQGQKIDFKELQISTMVNLNLSKVTTKDYIERALFMLKFTKEDLKNGL